ncbi:MAG: hypothetical protein QOJ33_2207 [Chloroflexota bacterium]|jgi:predicted DNA-binding antitoxin AbrB/MazE fold protein|nr:hypothetical protein [Chloroflexota bacterium]
MSQTITATYENGVLVPSQPLDLAANSKVRLTVETLQEGSLCTPQLEALAALEDLWRRSTIHSQGERLTRDQLHERR